MLNRTRTAAPTPTSSGPTSLLALVAGQFTSAVTAVWPAPHTAFLTAPAARRHLFCLALALGRRPGPHGELILAGRLRTAIAATLGPAPAGLARALGRLGEVAWPAPDYRRLLALLADGSAARLLHHAERIAPETVRRLDALPGPMTGALRLAGQLNDEGVRALGEAHQALRFRDGEAAARAAAARWSRAGSVHALFEAVRDDLYPEPAAPPHPGTPRLRPLASKAALREAARRFGNCLADQLPYAASGWSAFYEWLGEPGAVVEVARDHVFGWRLEQARLAGNAAVPETMREAIVGDLALMGVHVGRSGWELDRALTAAAADGFRLRPVEAVLEETFGE